MNILFLGGAKRVSMARMFEKAAAARGEQCKIYSYEMTTHVPIAAVGRVFVGLKWDDPDIYDDLLRLVDEYDISIIVPFVDGAIQVAARMRQMYPDRVFAPTCTPDLAEDMFDKVRAARVFSDHRLPIPATYRYDDDFDKLIAKPRRGSASQGLVLIDNFDQLDALAERLDDYLIQERIDNRVEYTVDCYVSVRSQEVVTIVPRKRMEVVGGEVMRTETVFAPEVFDLAKLTLSRIGLAGAVTIQVIHDRDTGRYMLMEVNPRLGGGAVCAVYAGADLPAMILADAAGEPLDFVCYRPNTEIARYLQEIAFYN